MILTAGVDVGSSSVKVAVMRDETLLARVTERIRRRETRAVVEEAFARALEEASVRREEFAYVASTGEGEQVSFRDGHFFGMTAHARGAIWLCPQARSVLDMGALHARAMRIDARSRVLNYQMTSQCASGTGQFIENIARYLGVGIDEVGALSTQATQPETVSSICAVLAETDVINMVSRGISTSDILKGIHLSVASRLVKLLKAVAAESPVTLTGGLAGDAGLAAALRERMAGEKLTLELVTHADGIYAGAIGAALWAGVRHLRRHAS